MKSFLRSATFVYIAVSVVVGFLPFFTAQNDTKTYFLFCLLLTLLFLFLRFLLEMLSLPSHGLGYVLISFILTLVVINIFFLLFSYVQINPVSTPSLTILGFVIPSVPLTKLLSTVVSALFISLIVNYLDWLGRKR